MWTVIYFSLGQKRYYCLATSFTMMAYFAWKVNILKCSCLSELYKKPRRCRQINPRLPRLLQGQYIEPFAEDSICAPAV